MRSSLLNWMRWLINVRNAHRAFGRGTITFLRSDNHKVVAYLRSYESETILCAANLSETAQAVEVELSEWAGCVPVDLFGASVFPIVRDDLYTLTLPGHEFYWLKLLSPEDAARRKQRPLEAMDRPDLPAADRPLPIPRRT
jgi:hypothetical protein